MDRGAWWTIVHEVTKESDTTEELTLKVLVTAGCQAPCWAPGTQGGATDVSLWAHTLLGKMDIEQRVAQLTNELQCS